MFKLLKIICICSLVLCAFAEEKKEEKKMETRSTKSTQSIQSRQWTVEEPWQPIWSPYYRRQPLYTWWAAPYTVPHHHEPLFHPHPIHHFNPLHHLEKYPVGIVPHPHPHIHPHPVPAPIAVPIVPHAVPAPLPLPGPIAPPIIPYHRQHHQHQAKYIAQTLGSVHVAPLLGHTENVVSTNLHPAPGRLLK